MLELFKDEETTESPVARQGLLCYMGSSERHTFTTHAKSSFFLALVLNDAITDRVRVCVGEGILFKCPQTVCF